MDREKAEAIGRAMLDPSLRPVQADRRLAHRAFWVGLSALGAAAGTGIALTLGGTLVVWAGAGALAGAAVAFVCLLWRIRAPTDG